MANIKQLKLPDNTTYDLKDESGSLSSHWHHDEDLKPLISKTYASTSYYATANDWANATWYFMSIKPDSWYKPFRVKLKVHSFCPSYSTHESYTWCTLTGRQNSIAFINWNDRNNSAHSYLTYYPLTQAGFNAGYGHAIGISIYNADNRTSSAYYRTFEVDYYECENCTVEFLDTPVKWANWTGTGTTNYGTLGSFDAINRGLQETGDNNTTVHNRIQFISAKTGAVGVWQTSLFMEDGNGTFQNICTAADGTVTSSNRTTATTKIANTHGFRVGGTIYYSTSYTYAANTNISNDSNVYSAVSIVDSRYAFNTTLTANFLTPYTSLYLVGTINATDGLYYLDQVWWTQTPNDTTKIYVLVGAVYDSTTSNCRYTLYEQNKWYKYDGSKLIEIVDTALHCSDATTVNGHTVNSDVPANAQFTDTTYTGTGAISVNASTHVISTTAEVNQNAFSNVKVGDTTIAADSKTDTVELVAGDNITLTPDATNDKVTISATDTTYESKTEASGGTDLSLVTTGDKWNWNRTLPFEPGLEVASLNDLVGLMNYSTDKRCFSGVIKIATNIGVGVTGWQRIIAIAQNAVNNGTYDIGMFCTFFPAGTSDFVNYALIDGKATGNYSVSKTGKFVTNVFASTVQITTAGNGQLNLGNNLASGATGKSRGRLVIFSNTDTHYSDIRATGLSDDRNLFCPNKSGTIAVTSDITDKKVEQVASTSGTDYYPVVLSSDTSNSNYTGSVVKSTTLSYSSSYGMLRSIVSGNTQWEVGSTAVYFGANQGGISNGNQKLTLYASNESNYQVCLGVIESAWAFYPAVSKKLRLGSPNRLWTTVYAQTGSINTSDRNEKKDIVPLNESAKDFIMALNPVSYKFKDGESGRTHYGMIAQDVEQEMAELGMTAMDFAGFCKDQKTISYETEENGQTVQKDMPVEGQYTYGLRYEEFIPAMIKTIQMQQQEIGELKQQLAEIKAMLNGGN